MKSFASKFNKMSTTFGIDTTDFKYTKLADIFNSKREGGKDFIHNINGLYVHDSQFGDSPVIIDVKNKRLVNLPSHIARTLCEILDDDETVQDIKDGKVGYKIYDYESHDKKCYSITFVNL